LFNLNVPTRVGFQCLSEDTKILTPEGWKSYNEIKKGDIIYTFNLNTGKLEKKPIKSIFIRKYKGPMYNLRNRSQDQLISPHHRVVRQIFNTNKYKLETIEDVLQMKSPIPIPVVAENNNPDINISDEKLKFLAWIFSEGTLEKNGSRRVSIYQSQTAHPENYGEIISLLNNLNLEFTTRYQTGLGTCVHMKLSPESSKIVHQWLGNTRKILPDFIFSLSKRQARLFLETYIKGDGWKEKHRKRITVTDEKILEGLEALAVLAGYNFSVRKRKPQGISKKVQYILTLTETKTDYIKSIKKVDYEGIIWSVHTENETVIAKRNGQVFITGNTPFTNLTFDLVVSPVYKDQPVVIGGKLQNKTYGEFQEEMNMINKAFFEVMLEGDAKGRVFTFPIPTYNITKDFDWNNEILDGLWKMTGKYGIPYFANFINSDMKPEDVRSMCCRLRLDTRHLQKKGGGLFGANPLTGSIGVVTINLPRIGYLSKSKEEFKSRLNDLLYLAKESLEIKRKVIERLTDENLYPYSKFYLRNVKERFGKYWVNHFSTVGIIGMNEACLNLFDKDIGSEEGIEFAKEIMYFIREKLEEFQEETGNIYNLEATPAEGTSYRLARIDKNKFPDIIVANEEEYRKGAEPFYTNSTHLPVNYTDDIFEVLEKQDQLQTLYTGGTVIHIFVGEKIDSKEGIKKLVKTICENFRLPYFTITPTFSVCPNDGYISGEYFTCPKCGSITEVYSRIVGYLRPVSQWNKGKYEEFKMRKTYVLK
jgi:ribonucleoside-triphosphate reductase